MAPIKFEDNMRDKLEKRTIQPSSEAWSKLASRLEEEKKPDNSKLFWWLGIAASVALLIFSSIFFFGQEQEQVGTEIVDTNTKPKIEKDDNVIKIEERLTSIEKEDIASETKEKENQIVKVQKEIKDIISQPNKVEESQLAQNVENRSQKSRPGTSVVAIAKQETSFEDKKFTDVMAEIKTLDSDGSAVTEREIDSLLKAAEKEIARNKIFNEDTQTVDADALLQDVEGELEQSFRTRVFEALKTSYNSVKTAVAERNN